MVKGEVGTYKIAYLKDNINILYSRMFDSIEPALDFGHKTPGRWLLFQKVGHDGVDYAWKMLPYGSHSSYRLGIKVDSAKWVIAIVLTLIAFYLFGKYFFKSPAKIY